MGRGRLLQVLLIQVKSYFQVLLRGLDLYWMVLDQLSQELLRALVPLLVTHGIVFVDFSQEDLRKWDSQLLQLRLM